MSGELKRLSSIIVDVLQQAPLKGDAGVAYVYCSYKEAESQTPRNLIASLLLQLLMQRDSLPVEVVALYERHAKHRTRPMLLECQNLLKDILSDFSQVYILVDGLDECPEAGSVRSDFLASVQELQPHASTLITSRYLPNIEKQLHGAVQLQLEPNDDDIRHYLEQRLRKWTFLERHLRKDPSLHDNIIKSILDKARRMFLLARLYIESLTRLITLRKVKAALTNLPDGLINMYDSVMDRVSTQAGEEVELAMKVLGWTFYAIRPLRLRELQHALALEEDDKSFDEDGLSDEDLMISVCGGLLTLQDGDRIAFIHYTCQEYFAERATTLFKDVRAQIPKVCLTYLSFDIFTNGACTNDHSLELRLNEYPFMEYASLYWASHLRNQDVQDVSVKSLAVEFLKMTTSVSAFNQVRKVCMREDTVRYPGYSQDFPKFTPGLLLAAEFGLVHIGDSLLNEGCDIEAEDSQGIRPLHQAIWMNETPMAEFLIDQGADCHIPIRSQGMTLHSSVAMQGSPIHLAASKGSNTLVQTLIAKGVDVHAQLENKWTPLHMAAANGHTSVIDILTRHGANINVIDSHGGSPVYRAAENGHTAVIESLIKHKADINICTGLQQTPLLRAAENGHEATVALLLEYGADWKAKDYLGWTPLYRAQDQGHDEVAKLLKVWIKQHRALQKG